METSNYIDQIKERLASLIRESPEVNDIDEQEMGERLEAARAYSEEDESHFVEYCYDCVDSSSKANTDIRRIQKECYDVYKENAPAKYSYKEDWQSKVVLPGPFGAVQTAMAAVRKAFTPSFISIESASNPEAARLWEKLLLFQLNKEHADFPTKFTDATGMGFAVGQSLEMIPVWREGRGLAYTMVEPWKIHRDPDAVSRDPQSGMYWIHQEYLDKYVLKELENDGKYQNVDRVTSENASGGTGRTPEDLTQDDIATRRNKVFQYSKFRKLVLVSEFWGVVLDKKGNMLLPRATYTVAGNHVIEMPRESPYRTLRWPGISFSPIPDFLSFEGRGILQGIRTLWQFMCSLFCLHIDNLNWVVNPMLEVDITGLVDQTDIDVIPGKAWLTRGSVNGQQVVRSVERSSRTVDILQNLKYADEVFQKSTFINDAIAGRMPSKETTAREIAQSLEQAMGVFGLMGENIESGALKAITAGIETIEINAGIADIIPAISPEQAEMLMDNASPTGIVLPQLDGGISVSGLTAILKDNETMKNLQETIIPLVATQTPFSKYINAYNILKSIETRVNLRDEHVIVSEEEAKQLDAAEQQQQAALMQQQQQAMQQELAMKQQQHDEKMAKIQKDSSNADVKLMKVLGDAHNAG